MAIMNQTCGTMNPSVRVTRSSGAGIQARIVQLRATLRTWRRRHTNRQALYSLDERTLRDVGLTVQQVQFEMHKPFWQE